jgi:hypothetical protein
VWLTGAGALLVIGWVFILFQNSFHVTAPVVFVCLGYGAGVAAVYTMFRAGASAVTGSGDEGDDAAWGRPVGARGELEREKKALLKAIKEAEFDLQMGKLSKADAEAMIGSYRAQAIAVIREIDRKDGGDASAREQIEREVRARLEVAKGKPAAEADTRQGKQGKQPAAASKKAEPAAEAEASTKADEATAKADEATAKADEVTAKADVESAKADEVTAKADEASAKADEMTAAEPSNAEIRGATPSAGVAKEATS